MKELLSFAFALLFISCQNQPFHNLALDPGSPKTETAQIFVAPESAACESNPEKTLDVAKELQDSRSPGLYYRETPMRSEFDFENGFEALVCTANVTNSDDAESPTTVAEEASSPSSESESADPIQAAANWDILTQKWEITPAVTTCFDRNAQSENPACEAPSFIAEDGKLFSSYFPEDLNTVL
jgi:hypothetical protein